jgi:type II secretory pathway pseudopilin PulG
MGPHTATGERTQHGFSYLSLLFFVAILSVGLAAVAVSWQTQRQREKEADLLFAGAAYREAIALYYNRSPGGLQEYPKRLRDLLADPRYPDTRRYLRRLYRDPMNVDARWGTITAPDGGIMGVHSLSTGKPVKISGAVAQGPDFGTAATYADWKFVYLPDALPVQAAAPAPLGDANLLTPFSLPGTPLPAPK